MFIIAGEAYVHMAPAKSIECTTLDDTLREDDVNLIESKNASPSTDSTLSGENPYAQIH